LEDRVFMRQAIAEARLAYARGEVPVGAVTVHRGRIIGRGHNVKETDKDPTAHAEILALRAAARTLGGWRLVDVTLYCTMEPCAMCAGAMVQARLPCLVYGVDDPKAGAAGSVYDLLNDPQANHQVVVRRGVLEADVRDLMAAFFQGLRDGSIPRFSADRRERRLAENQDSV
jgi:tRNA(adenine34) deaminase